MKSGILLYGTGNSDWVGGLYYIKNIAFVLSQNKKILKKHKIYILVPKDLAFIFNGLSHSIRIKTIWSPFVKFDKYYRVIFSIVHSIGIIFPCSSKIHPRLDIQGISWIPDFQHNRLTDMFQEDERNIRIQRSNNIIRNSNPLVLSSNDCKNDAQQYYGRIEKIYVVPFVSAIQEELKKIDNHYENCVLQKHNLQGKKYVYIANQFWKHKNHIVVLEAIRELISGRIDINLEFVFTGKLREPRFPEYIKMIRLYFEDIDLQSHIKNLGFLERNEQIVIMKNAEFVIQPSLFEGWGTVVEDAKVLDKTILLSDIPVHQEQKNEKCILFDPHDPVALANLIRQESLKEHHDDIEKGIADMYLRAKEYSKGFEQLLKDLEKRK